MTQTETTEHVFYFLADDDVFVCQECFASTFDLPENYDSVTLGECIPHPITNNGRK